MALSPSNVLARRKSTDGKRDKDDKGSSKRSSMLDFIAKHKHGGKHDVGKHNNGTTTGFKAVEKRAEREYGSKKAGERVAGAVYAKMRSK